MLQSFIYAIKADKSIIDDFIKRVSKVGIETEILNGTGAGLYLKSSWDDSIIPPQMSLKKFAKIGCPEKEITYDGKPVLCSSVYAMRNRGISDARIAELLDVSESTVTRRRKKHMEEGTFHANSNARF